MLLLRRVLDEKMNLLVLTPRASSLSSSLKSVVYRYHEGDEVKTENVLNRLVNDKPEVLSTIGLVRTFNPRYLFGILDLMCYLRGVHDADVLAGRVLDEGCLVVMPGIDEGDNDYHVFTVDNTLVESGIRIVGLEELTKDNPKSYYFVNKEVKAKLNALALETEGGEV